MFFKTSILILLMMQWNFQDITAEAQDIVSKLTNLSNDIKHLAKMFEENAKTTEDTMLELRGEENFQLSILTGQQKALENKIDILRINQDGLSQALGQIKVTEDEMKKGLKQMNLTQEKLMKQVESQIKLTQNEIKQEHSQMKLNQDKNNIKLNYIFDVMKILSCKLILPSLKTQIINNKTYFFSYDKPKMSWPEADHFCKSHGMDLFSIETQEEWDALKPEVDKLRVKFGTSPWSSGSDAAQEGNWKWASTGTDITFLAGKYRMDNVASQNCLFVYTKGWGDHPCLNKLPFICEQNTSC